MHTFSLLIGKVMMVAKEGQKKGNTVMSRASNFQEPSLASLLAGPLCA